MIGSTPPPTAVRRPIYTVSNAGLGGHRIQLVIGPAVVRQPSVAGVQQLSVGQEVEQPVSTPSVDDGVEQCDEANGSDFNNTAVDGIEDDRVFDETTGVMVLAEQDTQVC